MDEVLDYLSRKHVVDQAVHTYNLEIQAHRIHEVSLSRAMYAGFGSLEKLIVKAVIKRAIELAEALDQDADDFADDGPAALLLLAHELEETIPMDDRE